MQAGTHREPPGRRRAQLALERRAAVCDPEAVAELESRDHGRAAEGGVRATLRPGDAAPGD